MEKHKCHIKKLAQFIVGIKDKQNEIVGTCFVIAEKVIVTCGHVVQDIPEPRF